MNRSGRRYIRTLLIGTFALGALVWLAVDQFGVPREEIAELALASLLAVLAVIVGAGSAALLWIGLRTLWRRRPGK